MLFSPFSLYLSYVLTLSPHALMASTSELTSARTSLVSGGASLSMSIVVQRLMANHLSTTSIAASGLRPPAVVIAMLSWSALAHRARGANHRLPHRHPPEPETNRCAPAALEPPEESCASCARVAWKAGNHTDVDTLEQRMPVGRLTGVKACA